MKFLHTADWHLGKSLCGRKRYEEHSKFLEWLNTIIQQKNIDTLLVAGDIFDTSTPSNRAQELYYQFLCKVATSCCQNVIIIGGNHDSPSFLDAPKELLRTLNIYVIGATTSNPEDEVLILYDSKQIPQAIVCATPYLRDKDVRSAEPGETIDEKNTKLLQGVKKHYTNVCAIAEKKRSKLKLSKSKQIPIIAMGHLFTVGGKTVDGDGVRELYVGSLARVPAQFFPSTIDYLALGHLHVPQTVGRTKHIRYSGSPIPMDFGEVDQEKKVVLIEFNSTTPNIEEISVPCFQKLVRIVGSLDEIQVKLKDLKKGKSSAWLEIEYTGSDLISNLREVLEEAIAGSNMEIRRIKNRSVTDRVISRLVEDETLDDLNPADVFTRYLDAHGISDKDREELTVSYNEIIKSLYEEDVNAE